MLSAEIKLASMCSRCAVEVVVAAVTCLHNGPVPECSSESDSDSELHSELCTTSENSKSQQCFQVPSPHTDPIMVGCWMVLLALAELWAKRQIVASDGFLSISDNF